MTTQRENDRIDDLNNRMSKVELRMDEIIIPKLNKVVDYVDENKGGINTATLLNSKIITVVLALIVGAALFFAGKISL